MKNVEDIYPVTPMQEFMLLHGLGGHDDTLFNQFVFDVHTALDPDAFERAWNNVVAAHSALRTAFIWKGVEVPQQVVRQTATVGYALVDLETVDPAQRAERIAALLKQDREAGFDFRRAPLMRFTLVRLAPHEWKVVWSSHHLIVDRWCIDLLMADFQRHYQAATTQQAPARHVSPVFRDYVAWVQRQNPTDARRHWSSYLHGFRLPTLATEHLRAQDGQASETASTAIVDQFAAARALSARAGITLSTVIQAAVGLALARMSAQPDAVFGVTVAGRPADVSQVESIVGSFISTVPVRVRLDATLTVIEWLRQLHEGQLAANQFGYLSPADVRRCATLDTGQALYDTLMVWLAPTDAEAASSAQALPMTPASQQYATAFPLTLSVIESVDALTLRVDSSVGGLELTRLLTLCEEALGQLTTCVPDESVQQMWGQSLHRVRDDALTDIVTAERTESEGLATGRGREDVHLDLLKDLVQNEWQAVLNTSDYINDEDDFFALGGDSLKAAALHTRLEAATRKAIPLLALFESSTLTGMAATLFDERWPLRAGIAQPISSHGSGSPLFCVASPEVNTLGYTMLSRHLDAQQNMVVLQAPPGGDDLEQLHPQELPQFAQRYVEAMRTVQPTGPYWLLSMCSGSHIASEMVRMLEEQGEQVAFAGVVNTWSLYSISRRFYVNRLLNVAEYYQSRLRGLFPGRARPSEQLAMAGADGETTGRPKPRVLPADSAVGLSNPWIAEVGFANRLPERAASRVRWSIFRLDRQPFWRIGEPTLGWRRLTGNAHAIRLEGDDHDAILREPQVKAMATALAEELANARADFPEMSGH
ncbi:MAG: condensation domain-containing protein [Pseudomonadota bacterium]